MKAPPVAPLCSWIRPACSSERKASRSVLRETPNCSDIARSEGSRWPTLRRPSANSSLICLAISSNARDDRIRWNFAGVEDGVADRGDSGIEKFLQGVG
jgi:hypothetical protein